MHALLLGCLLSLGPADVERTATPSTSTPTQTVDDYGTTTAQADVETILTDTSKAYLQARARLEAHPDVAGPILRARLEAVPAPGPSARGRLLGVLAELHRAEDLPLFEAQLRRTLINAAPGSKPLELAKPWRNLLLAQGTAAVGSLLRLIGDTALDDTVRAALLEDLVELHTAQSLAELTVLVGRGDAQLEETLRRALLRRARTDRPARDALIAATDASLDRALEGVPEEAARLPRLLRFRAGLSQEPAAGLVDRLHTVAKDPKARFGARVAAVRGLGILPDDAATEVLQSLARTQLDATRRMTQPGEILGSLAIASLPDEQAATLSRTLKLIDADAPRLAVLGYRHAPRTGGHPWLQTAIDNPWPQVRQAAFEHVDAPCQPADVDLLATRGSSTDLGGDTDRATARAAVAALGRCGGPVAFKALRDILKNANGDIELRAEAARRLARHGGIDGADAVATLLNARPEPAFARRLAAALRHAPNATKAVDEALCRALENQGPVARAAADSLRTLHPDRRDPCTE